LLVALVALNAEVVQNSFWFVFRVGHPSPADKALTCFGHLTDHLIRDLCFNQTLENFAQPQGVVVLDNRYLVYFINGFHRMLVFDVTTQKLAANTSIIYDDDHKIYWVGSYKDKEAGKPDHIVALRRRGNNVEITEIERDGNMRTIAFQPKGVAGDYAIIDSEKGILHIKLSYNPSFLVTADLHTGKLTEQTFSSCAAEDFIDSYVDPTTGFTLGVKHDSLYGTASLVYASADKATCKPFGPLFSSNRLLSTEASRTVIPSQKQLVLADNLKNSMLYHYNLETGQYIKSTRIIMAYKYTFIKFAWIQ